MQIPKESAKCERARHAGQHQGRSPLCPGAEVSLPAGHWGPCRSFWGLLGSPTSPQPLLLLRTLNFGEPKCSLANAFAAAGVWGCRAPSCASWAGGRGSGTPLCPHPAAHTEPETAPEETWLANGWSITTGSSSEQKSCLQAASRTLLHGSIGYEITAISEPPSTSYL